MSTKNLPSFFQPIRRWAQLCVGLCTLAGLLLPVVQADAIYSYKNSQGDQVFTDQPTKGAKKIHVDPPPPIPLTPINLPPATPVQPPSAPAGAPLAPAAAVEPSSPAPKTPLVPSVLMRAPTELAPEKLAPKVSASSPDAGVSKSPAQIMPAPKVSASAHGHYQSLVINEPKSGLLKAHPGGTIFVQINLTPVLDVTAGDRVRIVIDGEDKVEDSIGHRFMISGLTNGEHTLIALVARQGKNIFQSSPVVIHLTGASS